MFKPCLQLKSTPLVCPQCVVITLHSIQYMQSPHFLALSNYKPHRVGSMTQCQLPVLGVSTVLSIDTTYFVRHVNPICQLRDPPRSETWVRAYSTHDPHSDTVHSAVCLTSPSRPYRCARVTKTRRQPCDRISDIARSQQHAQAQHFNADRNWQLRAMAQPLLLADATDLCAPSPSSPLPLSQLPACQTPSPSFFFSSQLALKPRLDIPREIRNDGREETSTAAASSSTLQHGSRIQEGQDTVLHPTLPGT